MNSEDVSNESIGITCSCGSCSTEPASHEKDADLARRGFLRSAITGTVAGMLAGATVANSRTASAQSALTPDAALKAMMDGNQRYVGGQLQSLSEDLSILKAKTAEKQDIASGRVSLLK